MARNKLLATAAALAVLTAVPLVQAGAAPRAEVFFDDFSGTELDRSKWTVEVTGENFGTVNQEQQAYVDSPETIYVEKDPSTGAENGALALHPRYKPGTQAPDGQTYDFVSGRVKTQDKVEFTYGSYSARLKLPENATASGLWPAWWSLGANIDNGKPWPDCGEIDVMEHVGEPWTSSALHGPEYHGDTPFTKRQEFAGGDPADWHVYRSDWTPDGIAFFVDDTETYRVTKDEIQGKGWTWAYDDPQFLILNFALGGGYPNGVNGVTEPYFGLPQSTVDRIATGEVRYLIDWVRVEQP
ncbi:Glycosyl hydrolases family 16 [Saccharopolyspora antimicrobica]|uniref:Glycosyl hydrolase family 16 n=1 Tax=Saccharopolyspora antimicrobica TaxID=455193 RepID=A0A1I5DAB5_9PSEU|nr:glycoside hydrolase family 16 protein [Saccharopolyspora antimicrobica]RKT85186.1 glycosyl hydrolase family 16 [Saccharopolyspora antimicrobica]SFN96214.1 Glycosyl hydrolases family 16 [Saccharopolyspora antimicrobica]